MVKNWNCGQKLYFFCQKLNFLVKNSRIFGHKSKFWSKIKILSKIEIWVKNWNFCQKSKFWSNIEIIFCIILCSNLELLSSTLIVCFTDSVSHKFSVPCPSRCRKQKRSKYRKVRGMTYPGLICSSIKKCSNACYSMLSIINHDEKLTSINKQYIINRLLTFLNFSSWFLMDTMWY